jgi:actin-like ATPase involved in cell morphogenesis
VGSVGSARVIAAGSASVRGRSGAVLFVTMLVMSPGPQGTSLGVDFGTSHTIAVVRRADGSLRPLLFDGAPLMPSAVCADADGGLLVGRDAVHAGRRHPERFEPNPKRLIDRPSTLLGAREYPVPDLIAAVLHAVAEECRRVVGRPAQATLTVPAEWGPARRQVVEDAAARAGLGRVRLVPEPVAAATYYAESLKHSMAVGSSIVVYDLGAGTFDASVVRRTDGGFTAVALDGRGDLGGLDIDAALIDHLGGTYGEREGWKRLMNPTTVEERRHFRDFQEEIRGAKERLSRHQQSDIAIPLLDVEAHLTRTELESIAQPHLEQTIRVTQAVIRAAGLDVAASAGVFLVGGASRMPLVATMLHRALGLAPTVLDQPEIVVAEGSVLWQADDDGAAFAIQRNGLIAPLTPAAAPGTPNPAPTPQAAFGLAPITEPQALPVYRPSPPEPHTAPVAQQSPVRQTLPPQTHQQSPTAPSFTPPASVPGDDADPPEPPLTEAERQRRKRIGTRAVVAIILVNVLVIAGLAYYFGPYGNDAGGSEDDFDAEFGFGIDADLGTSPIGTLVDEIIGAHEGPVSSLAFVETDAGPMLFSAGTDATLYRWSMVSGERIGTYPVTEGVNSLWTTNLEGEPTVVMVDNAFQPYLWNTATDQFTSAGSPAMAEPDLVRVGNVDSQPVLGLVTDEGAYEMYFIADEYSEGVRQLPEGLILPRFFASDATGLTQVATINAAKEIEVIDGSYGGTTALSPDPALLDADATVSGMGVVHDGGVPYAMVYADDKSLFLWDLDAMTWHLAAGYETLDDEFHNEIVHTEDGAALMYTDQAGDCHVYSLEFQTTQILENETTGTVTKMEDIVLDDGREFAVTGDEYGNLQIWSLGL